MKPRDLIVARFLSERERHADLPGLEDDMMNSPNDWAAIITSYLGECVRRGGTKITRTEFEDSMVKAAAVIIAAIEHCDVMKQHFSENPTND